jgi:hypothetical protein
MNGVSLRLYLFDSPPSIRVEKMIGKIGMLSVVAVLFFAAGCTMCCHPYDKCGPVYDDCSGHPYCSSGRAGSILENPPAHVEGAAIEEVVEGNSDSVSASRQRQSPTENEPRMLSEADRKVGERAAISNTQSARRTTNQAGDYHSPAVRRR